MEFARKDELLFRPFRPIELGKSGIAYFSLFELPFDQVFADFGIKPI